MPYNKSFFALECRRRRRREHMAWTTPGEEIRTTLLNYTTRLSLERKTELKNIYGKAINPFWGEWTTPNQVIFVNLRNQENVLSNLKLAMLKELVGLGPHYYYVIKYYNFDFESLLMFVLHYLPKDKFCIYPEEETLEGPFLHSPWDILSRRICAGPSISINHYLAYLAYKVREIAPM